MADTQHSPQESAKMIQRTAHGSSSPKKQQKKMQIRDIRGPKDFFLWYWEDKTGRWPIVVFVMIFILAIIFMIIAIVSYQSVYVVSGIVTLIVALFGVSQFKTLMKLKQEVDEYESLNENFRKENGLMSQQISKVKQGVDELTTQRQRLEELNATNARNLEKMQNMEKNLKQLGLKNAEGMKGILSSIGALNTRLHLNLKQTERNLFLRAFDNMEFKDEKEGMTENEYKQFLQSLPPAHRRRIKTEMTFQDMAGSDNTIDIEEFSQLLDKLAKEMQQSSFT